VTGLFDAALERVHAQLALGHAGFEAEGARFVRDPSLPRIYDANFVWRVRAATPIALEALLARVELEYAGVGHRAFRLDPGTPPAVAARLALEGYERSDSLVLLLEGEPAAVRGRDGGPGEARPGPPPCAIRPVETEADWGALARSARTRRAFAGASLKPVDLAIGDEELARSRAKCPPQRTGSRSPRQTRGFLACGRAAGGSQARADVGQIRTSSSPAFAVAASRAPAPQDRRRPPRRGRDRHRRSDRHPDAPTPPSASPQPSARSTGATLRGGPLSSSGGAALLPGARRCGAARASDLAVARAGDAVAGEEDEGGDVESVRPGPTAVSAVTLLTPGGRCGKSISQAIPASPSIPESPSS
jgi:hypothetical protein